MMSLLLASSEERSLMKDIASFVGGMGSGILSSKMQLPDLLSALKGEIAPSETLQNVAKFVMATSGNPVLRAILENVVNDTLKRTGHDRAALNGLVKRLSSPLGYEPPDDLLEEDRLYHFLHTLSERVLNNAVGSATHAVTQCPSCGYSYLLIT